jgi:hypothetical protein
LVVPLTVGAIDVLIPNAFSNGSVANADEVNENFGALESGANTLLFESTSSVMAALPHTFSNGTVADALEVNANFAAIESAIETASTANASAVAAACTAGGGTWDAGTSTCTPASSYNCFVGGFCAQAAIEFPPATYGYTNVYDGDTRGTEPALGAGCNTAIGSGNWLVGAFVIEDYSSSFPFPFNVCASN